MGHSRGGAGVRAAYYLYQHDWAVTPSWSERIPGLAIRGIFEIGPSDDPIYDPVDANITYRLNADGVAWNVLLPVCDGDIKDWQGLRPFDRMILNAAQTPAAEKSKYAVWGANHNFYNTEWVQNDGNCVGSRSNIALSNSEQQKTALDSLEAFFRGNVYSPVINDPLVGSDEPAFDPNYNRQFNPLFDLSPESLNISLFHVQRFDRAFTHSANAVTLKIEDFTQPTGIQTSNVSIAYGPVPEHEPDLQAAAIGWDTASANTFFKVNLTQPIDVRAYRSLDFSVSRQNDSRNRESPVSEYFSDTPTNFSVSLIYMDGTVERTSSSVQLTTYTELLGPVGQKKMIDDQPTEILHFILQTIRIPLTDFANVNLSQVKGVQFTFDGTTQGAIYLTNIQLASQP
jgi:hypothetical protein